MCVHDRTWYGRVLVERVEGFAGKAEWKRAYREIVNFESSLCAEGAVIVKFWIHTSSDEQLRRFKAREKDPLKSWKLTDDDWRNREKRPAYEQALGDMLRKTDHDAAAVDADRRREQAVRAGRGPRSGDLGARARNARRGTGSTRTPSSRSERRRSGLATQRAHEFVAALGKRCDQAARARQTTTELLVPDLDREQRVLQLGDHLVGGLNSIGGVLERGSWILGSGAAAPPGNRGSADPSAGANSPRVRLSQCP